MIHSSDSFEDTAVDAYGSLKGVIEMEELTTEWLEGVFGRALTDTEQRYMKWINGLDKETIQVIGGMIDQAHRFGYISGQK